MAAPDARPDAHAQRYDRQLRLWASTGQASLETASVLLIGCTAQGCAALKNLVLPGLGSFTILDPRKVTPADKGSNFFIAPDAHEHQDYRAESAVTLLKELNPSTKGEARCESVTDLLESDPTFFTSFTLVIASELPQAQLYRLSQLCWDPPGAPTKYPYVPLLHVRSSGFVAEQITQIKELGVIETHPESYVSMRIVTPWPELEQFAFDMDMAPQDTMTRAHIPMLVILIRALHHWKQEHDGRLPVPSQDRAAFKSLVWSYQHPDVDTENLEEAAAAINSHVWRPINQLIDGKDEPNFASVPTDVQAILRDPMCDTLAQDTPKFWLLVRALRDYVTTPVDASPRGGGGYLPQSATLPDMKALSDVYVGLRKVYVTKAESDIEAFTQHLKRVVQLSGQSDSTFSDEEIRSFTKHAAYLVLIRGRKLQDQFERPNPVEPFMVFSPDLGPPTLPHHIAFLAASNFFTKHDRLPGSSTDFSHLVQSLASKSVSTATTTTSDVSEEDISDEQYATDVAELTIETRQVATRFQADLDDETTLTLLDQAATEMVRAGMSSVPSTSALMGGVVAQEAIKYITRQYIPEKNTVVYSGVEQTVGVFDL